MEHTNDKIRGRGFRISVLFKTYFPRIIFKEILNCLNKTTRCYLICLITAEGQETLKVYTGITKRVLNIMIAAFYSNGTGWLHKKAEITIFIANIPIIITFTPLVLEKNVTMLQTKIEILDDLVRPSEASDEVLFCFFGW